MTSREFFILTVLSAVASSPAATAPAPTPTTPASSIATIVPVLFTTRPALPPQLGAPTLVDEKQDAIDDNFATCADDAGLNFSACAGVALASFCWAPNPMSVIGAGVCYAKWNSDYHTCLQKFPPSPGLLQEYNTRNCSDPETYQ